MKAVLAVLAICLTLAVVDATAPLLNRDAKNVVPDQYMVVFHRNSTVAIRDLHVAELKTRLSASEKIINTFDIGHLIGYSAVLTKANLAAELEHSNVRYIEADQICTIVDDGQVVQKDPTWGLDRIDQETLPLDDSYSYFESAGAGVYSYIIDTGIQTTHTEFAPSGRAIFGFDSTGQGNTDGNGHGTHVAGTVGGVTYGVAKKTTLVAVKVLGANGSGTWAGVVAGVDYVTKDHSSRGSNAQSVANMSLGGGATATLDEAVEESIVAGVNYAVAAGNSAANACNYSPARVGTAVTVGATDDTDTRAYFSNYGQCVDIFAPGVDITSAWIGSNTATNTISGTSMAAPHVAGAIAVHLAHLTVTGQPAPSPIDVEIWVKLTGTPDVISDVGSGSPNTLLFSPFSDVDL